MSSFRAKLFRYPGPGGWHFVTVPTKYSPPPGGPWGRTPVRATVDEKSWDTSVWWDSKTQSTLLAVPAKIRGNKGDGDSVSVLIENRVP